MKRVLMTLAIVLAAVVSVSLDCPDVSASFVEDVGSLSVEGGQAPQGGQGESGVCGGEGTDGDPDDLGGGFRSTHGQTKQPVGEIKPPVPVLVNVMLNLQRIWMTILR